MCFSLKVRRVCNLEKKSGENGKERKRKRNLLLGNESVGFILGYAFDW
jgi:hypothetical protein